MFKRFLIGLLKTVVALSVSFGIIAVAVSYIYNEYAIDSQVLIEEYEQIKQEKPVRTPPPTPSPTPTPTPAPTPEPDWPYKLDVTSWEYVLVDKEDTTKDYTPPKVVYFDGCRMDQRIVKDMEKLLVTARNAKISIYVATGYLDAKAATAEKADACALEHQTGLAIDFLQGSNAPKDASAATTPLFLWLDEHAAEYGFILRYPAGKEEITGVAYAPYHFRYVGVEAATYIKKNGLCLEEFLALYETE